MEFRELKSFCQKIDKIASADDFALLQLELMEDPEKVDLITGTGGARKIRMRIGAKGMRRRKSNLLLSDFEQPYFIYIRLC